MSDKKNTESLRPITERVIDLLRFPLIVGVVIIHAVNMPMSNIPDERSFDVSPFYNIISRLFSDIIMSSVVPTFFLISGFLFFYKVESFGKREYVRKLKSRFRTLLIPYLFWNLLTFVVLNIAIKFPALDKVMQINHYEGAESIITSLVLPVEAQFWFIKDLMVLVVLSPLVNWLVTRTRHFGIILLAIGWFVSYDLPHINEFGLGFVSSFFFSAGAWCAYNKGNLHWIGKDFKYAWILWACLVVAYFLLPDGWWNGPLMRLIILLGVITNITAAVYVCERWKLNGGGLLAASSFFIFAAHNHYLESPARKLLVGIIHPDSDFEFLLVYFGQIFFAVVVGLLIYRVLCVLTPRSLAFITGGRVQKCSGIVKNL